LARFAREHPRGARFIERLRTQYMRSSGDPARLDRMLNDVLHEIAAPVLREKSTRPVLKRDRVGGPHPLPHRIWYGMATAVIGVLGVFIGWHSGIQHRFQQPFRSMSTYATTNGQRATITLLDGTTVVLGVASRLDVPDDFATGNHQVALTGEALFTVLHHAGTPFTVVASGTQTRVLGTSFVVRHYPRDTVTTVAVRDGKVLVDSAVVTAQYLAEVGSHRTLALRRADPSVFSFATGVLTLNVVPLPDAIPDLDRWFDVDIRLGDPALARKRIDGRFTTGSVAELIKLFEMAYDVRVVRTGRVITLLSR
jgi:transmembrane sensor